MNPRCPFALLLGCTLAAGIASAERRDHDAHVHGIAEMDVTALGETVEIELRSPAMNLVGFEHEPRSGEERERSRAALASLRDGESLFVFEGAVCRQDEARARWLHEPHDHEHGHDAGQDHDEAHGHEDGHGHEEEHHDHARDDERGHDDDTGDAHADIHAHYHFDCDRAPSAIGLGLFERFPGTGEIRARFIIDSAQGARVLTPASSTLALE